MSEDHVARMALVITELANNLELHTEARRRFAAAQGQPGETRSASRSSPWTTGPGTANFSRFMRDGYSTAGTPGTGLGAVERASQTFEVHSQPEMGTTLLCQVWGARSPGGK